MAAAARIRGAVDAASARNWLAAIDGHPAWQRRNGDHGSAFNPQSSSLRLIAVDGLDIAAIAGPLLAGEVGGICRARLGSQLACDVDQCWVRRQYAPARCPPNHAPHGWHQDGALGFDFLGAPAAAGSLLSMVTCWIALSPCGTDAPGLEFVDDDGEALLPLAALADEVVRTCHRQSELVHPVLETGDALVFGGGVLHHTHVRPQMTCDRTSLELRFFAVGRVPDRLRGDRFLNLQ